MYTKNEVKLFSGMAFHFHIAFRIHDTECWVFYFIFSGSNIKHSLQHRLSPVVHMQKKTQIKIENL